MPVVTVVVRVLPLAKLLSRVHVPAAPLKVMGKSCSVPPVLIVSDVVAANVHALVPAVRVPAVYVYEPYIVIAMLLIVVPLALMIRLSTAFDAVNVTVPPVLNTLMLNELATVGAPRLRVLVTAADPVISNSGLPLEVSPVNVVVSTTVAVVSPVITTLPVDLVRLRVLALLLLKKPMLNVKVLRARVPAVNVTVRVAPTVKLAPNWNVPPTPLNVIGKSCVVPDAVIVSVPLVEAKVHALAPAVNVPDV